MSVKSYYIMGYSRLGKYLKEFLGAYLDGEFLGFLDNKVQADNVYKPEDIFDRAHSVFVGSINYMYEMQKQLEDLGFENVVSFGELTCKYPKLQEYNQAFYRLKEDYELNKEKYEGLRKILADEKSVKVLDTIIKFRRTFDVNLYSTIADDIENQYFENFVPKDIDTFVDGGAFDGDTVLRMCRHGIRPKKIYFFEPDEYSLALAKNTLKDIKGIEYYPFGFSDEEKVLKFDSRGDLGSCFCEDGDLKIRCVSLDETVKEDRAFIKMDIEGSEMDALNGAKRLIKNGSPLAICVYHKPSDIWKVPQLLSNYYKYKFYLRHYTNSIFDTILYGVPQ